MPVKSKVVNYCIIVYDGVFENDTIGEFESSTPFMPLHVGDELVRPDFVPVEEGNNFLKVTAVRHRVYPVSKTELCHSVEVCVLPLKAA